MEIDEKGRVNVSAKELLPKPEKKEERKGLESGLESNGLESGIESKEEAPKGERRFFCKKLG
mgnify:CR=1 FL=1